MNDKTFTEEKINEITNRIFLQYHELFQADKMSFHDWLLIKSIITDIQINISEGVLE